jgi:hypothetical protein
VHVTEHTCATFVIYMYPLPHHRHHAAHLQYTFYLPTADAITAEGTKWVLGFVALAVVNMMGYLMESYGFATSGERMTRRLREMAFKAVSMH